MERNFHDEADVILTMLHRHAIQHAVAGSANMGCADYLTDEGSITVMAKLEVTQVTTSMTWQKSSGESPYIGWPVAHRLIKAKIARLCESNHQPKVVL